MTFYLHGILPVLICSAAVAHLVIYLLTIL